MQKLNLAAIGCFLTKEVASSYFESTNAHDETDE